MTMVNNGEASFETKAEKVALRHPRKAEVENSSVKRFGEYKFIKIKIP